MLRLTRLSLLLAWFVMLLSTALPTNAARSASLPYRELNRPDRGPVYAIAWSPDGKQIAVGTEQGLWLYSATWADFGHNADAPIHALAWSPDGKTIAAGYFGKQGNDGTIKGGGLKLWKVSGGTIHLGNQLAVDGSVYALRFSPDGSQLASLSQMLETYGPGADISSLPYGLDFFALYNTASAKQIASLNNLSTLTIQKDAISQAANNLIWSHNGRYVAFGLKQVDSADQGTIDGLTVWDTLTMQSVDVPQPEPIYGPTTVVSVEWNPTDTLLAFSQCGGQNVQTQIVPFSFDNTATPDAPSNKGLTIPGDSTGRSDSFLISAFAWQLGGKYLAGAQSSVIRIWDAASYQLTATLDAALDDVTMLAWIPDGSQLLSAGSDYHVRLWTQFTEYAATGLKPNQPITLPYIVEPSAVSPDRRLAAVKLPKPAVDGSQFVIADLATGKTIRALQWPPSDTMSVDPTDALEHFVWSANGQFIASQAPRNLPEGTTYDQPTVIWSALTGKIIHVGGNWGHFAWSPDGKAVAVVVSPAPGDFANPTVEIHDSQTDKLLSTVQVLLPLEAGTNGAPSSLFVAQWSSDGRLIAVDEDQPGGTYGFAAVHLIDTKTNKVVLSIAAPKPHFAGSGDSASLLGLTADGKGGYTILVVGFESGELAHLKWQGSLLTVTKAWVKSSVTARISGDQLFSNDGHYVLAGNVILDATNNWPVAKLDWPIITASPVATSTIWSTKAMLELVADLQAQTTQMFSWPISGFQ